MGKGNAQMNSLYSKMISILIVLLSMAFSPYVMRNEEYFGNQGH